MGLRRRSRRKTGTSAPASAGDLDGIEGLRAWALSQPWVRVQTGGMTLPDLCKYVIDCPPLDVRRVWLTIFETRNPPELFAFFTLREGHVSCVTFATESSDSQQLERSLRRAYESAFAGCAQ
jgi:hypothetical protein